MALVHARLLPLPIFVNSRSRSTKLEPQNLVPVLVDHRSFKMQVGQTYPEAHAATTLDSTRSSISEASAGVGADRESSSPLCFLILYNVGKRHNIGMIIRSATAFNVHEVRHCPLMLLCSPLCDCEYHLACQSQSKVHIFEQISQVLLAEQAQCNQTVMPSGEKP